MILKVVKAVEMVLEIFPMAVVQMEVLVVVLTLKMKKVVVAVREVVVVAEMVVVKDYCYRLLVLDYFSIYLIYF